MVKKRLLLKNSINIIICYSGVISLVILAFEIYLKIFNPIHLTGINNAYRYDEEFGIVAKKGYFSRVTDFKQELFVNKFGTINHKSEFYKYKKLIFSIGDSYTQGTGLPMDNSYPFQLDLMLNFENEKYKNNYGVVNLGLAGFGGEQNKLAYQKYSSIIGRPNYVLYLGCDNDFRDDIKFLTGFRHLQLIEGNDRYGIFLKPLIFIGKSEIGKRIQLIAGNIKYKISESKINKKIPNIEECKTTAEKQIEVLNYFKEESRNNDFRLIVSWTFSPYKENESCSSYFWLKQWASNNNVEFADWVPSVYSVKNEIPDLQIENDHSGGHYRSWVANLIAQSFEKIIKK